MTNKNPPSFRWWVLRAWGMGAALEEKTAIIIFFRKQQRIEKEAIKKPEV